MRSSRSEIRRPSWSIITLMAAKAKRNGTRFVTTARSTRMKNCSSNFGFIVRMERSDCATAMMIIPMMGTCFFETLPKIFGK